MATPKWRRASVPTSWRSECRATRRKPWTCRRKPKPREGLYGIDQKRTNEFGTRCLLARRLVERGVRFVQLYSGGGPVSVQWDAHKDLVGNHEKMCGMTDLPVAGLLKDLKQRGLLDSTLVIWGAEFGRLPMSQGGDGRDHNPHGVHHVVRRRRREARHDRRRDRRDGTPGSRLALLDARFPRDDPASARDRSEPAVVPAQRPQRKAHRFRRNRDQGHARLIHTLFEPHIVFVGSYSASFDD